MVSKLRIIWKQVATSALQAKLEAAEQSHAAAVEEYEATLTAAVTSSKSAASDHHELLESLTVEVEAMRVEQSGLVEVTDTFGNHA